MDEYILRTRELSKRYGKHTVVDKISVNIRKGSIYGLVGRNGAGKTTFMKMICNLANATSGSFELVGIGPDQIGNLIETPGFYDKMSAADNLRAKARLYGRDDPAQIQEILRLVGLSNVKKKPAGKFSLGMLQRLGIGLALIGKPQLLVLDEPINGLDPTGVAEIREILHRLNREQGITILISSHILGELSKLATDYGFIEKGSLLREITGEQLLSDCTESVRLSVNDRDAASALLGGIGITGITCMESGDLQLMGCTDRTAEITELLVQNGIKVYEIAKQGIDLEQYYLNMIGGQKGV
ncbi:MAG: ATP-binding cassette domain-containing protein [Oscillospiraceae bacterium]|nr:ATP-binding cassette domain-containing protein [Oscillospiraceae bacterium]